MIERIDGISTLKQKRYVIEETNAHDELIKAGYTPSGCDMKLHKVVVFKIENANRNNEKRELYYFKNWQEAVETLIKK